MSSVTIGRIRFYDPLLEKMVDCDLSSWYNGKYMYYDYEQQEEKTITEGEKLVGNVITFSPVSPKENKK